MCVLHVLKFSGNSNKSTFIYGFGIPTLSNIELLYKCWMSRASTSSCRDLVKGVKTPQVGDYGPTTLRQMGPVKGNCTP